MKDLKTKNKRIIHHTRYSRLARQHDEDDLANHGEICLRNKVAHQIINEFTQQTLLTSHMYHNIVLLL